MRHTRKRKSDEREDRIPNAYVLVKMAEALNISIDELVTGEDKPKAEKPKTLADYPLEELLREIKRRIE
jgi:transcriptional regulator with XRE-family HTH domain